MRTYETFKDDTGVEPDKFFTESSERLNKYVMEHCNRCAHYPYSAYCKTCLNHDKDKNQLNLQFFFPSPRLTLFELLKEVSNEQLKRFIETREQMIFKGADI